MTAPTTMTLFDDIYSDDGTVLANATVTCTLDSAVQTFNGGLISARTQSALTNSAGHVSFTVIANDLLTPSGSAYIISVPSIGRTWQSAPQSANGTSQRSTAGNVLVSTPQTLAPAGSLSGSYTGSADLAIRSLVTAKAAPFTPSATPGQVHAASLVVDGTLAGDGIAVNAAGDIAARSFTASSSGPYTQPAFGRAGDIYPGGSPYVSLIGAGADPSGATDSTAAVKAAVAKCVSLGYGAIGCEPGTYLLSTIDGNGLMVALSKGLTFFALVPGTATFTIPNSVGNWWAWFGSVNNSPIDLSDLHFYGLIFDGNSTGNPIGAGNVGTLAATPRYVASAYAGSRISAEGCQFKNFDNQNLMVFNGSVNGMTDAAVRNCRTTAIGGGTSHDHTSFYLDAMGVDFVGNRGVAISTIPSNAVCFAELHGSQVDEHDNLTQYYAVGCRILTEQAATVLTGSDSYHSHDSRWLNVAQGLNLAPQVDTTNWDIHDHIITVDIDRWSSAFAGTTLHIGINGRPLGSTSQFRIHDNEVTYLSHTGANETSSDVGICLIHASTPGTDDYDVGIYDNTVRQAPAAAFEYATYLNSHQPKFSGNRSINCGTKKFNALLEAVFLVANGGVVSDGNFDDTTGIDDQGTHSMSTLVYVDPAGGTSPTLTNCTMARPRMRVADGTILPLATIPSGQSLALTNDGDPFSLGFPTTFDPEMVNTLGALGTNIGYYFRWRGKSILTINKVGIDITTSAGNLDIALYRNSGDGRAAKPTGGKIVSTGSTASPGTGYREIALGASYQVFPGDWVGISCDGATFAIRGVAFTATVSNLADGRCYLQNTAFPLPTTPSTLLSRVGVGYVLVGIPG